ncbi:MAG: hypothetical protein CBD74_07770 [Saprospirales bacterium TMED214]|nr:MAG: hypothetical protein CBD74_07770 [Saprospirales bacterium TMED214]
MTSNILLHLQDLRKAWRDQDFRYTKDQKEQYDMLLQARRDRVSELYKEKRVWSGPKISTKSTEEEED